jgi:hypothetical protein
MTMLDDHELAKTSGGRPSTSHPHPTLPSEIDWVERWYWELTH